MNQDKENQEQEEIQTDGISAEGLPMTGLNENTSPFNYYTENKNERNLDKETK